MQLTNLGTTSGDEESVYTQYPTRRALRYPLQLVLPEPSVEHRERIHHAQRGDHGTPGAYNHHPSREPSLGVIAIIVFSDVYRQASQTSVS